MGKGIQAIRGMNDCLPAEAALWQRIETVLRQVLCCYGYSEIRLPVVEKTSLFKRAIGEFTDVVEKEMYTFGDRNDESLTLRPEGTAGCVRAGIEHGLLYHNQEQRLWYSGPMFRYERPQKGRYRQFHQLGAEVFGLAGPDIDAELILLTVRCWKVLGIDGHVRLELNSIGSLAARVHYRDALIKFLQQHQDKLDEDCRRRMHVNPLRVLDSKNPDIQLLLNDAPLFSSCLDDDSRQHFAQLRSLLDNAGIPYRVNEKLVRGLDYYNKTVFEWVTDDLGAQGTVCAGGRYDGLVEQLGGQDTPAIGFAIGMERLVLLAQKVNSKLTQLPTIDVYLIYSGEGTQHVVMKLAETLRDAFPHLKLMTHYGGGSIKKQFSRADKRGARLALMSGENEITAGQIVVKDLHNGQQETLALCRLNAYLAMIFA